MPTLTDQAYRPRHYAGADSADARLRHDQFVAHAAVQVLAACDTLPAARALYRELHRAGVLLPRASRGNPIPAADLIARELPERAA